MTKTAALACAGCGQPLAPRPLASGLRVEWGHAGEPEDGHMAVVPVLRVTYRRDGAYWDAEADEVPGLPARGFASLDEARSCAWVLLRKVTPPRPVAEHVTGEGEMLEDYAPGWNIKGGTTLTQAGPAAGT